MINLVAGVVTGISVTVSMSLHVFPRVLFQLFVLHL